MTEEVTPKDIFESLNITKILMAIIQTQKEIIVPVESFLAVPEGERELQVDYDSDSKSFTFKFRDPSEVEVEAEDVSE